MSVNQYVNAENETNFDSFGVEHIPKKKYLLVIKILQQIFVEYKHMKSISILKGKVCQSIHIFFLLIIWKEWQNNTKIFSIESK